MVIKRGLLRTWLKTEPRRNFSDEFFEKTGKQNGLESNLIVRPGFETRICKQDKR
jgi:hypothetical protein